MAKYKLFSNEYIASITPDTTRLKPLVVLPRFTKVEHRSKKVFMLFNIMFYIRKPLDYSWIELYYDASSKEFIGKVINNIYRTRFATHSKSILTVFNKLYHYGRRRI